MPSQIGCVASGLTALAVIGLLQWASWPLLLGDSHGSTRAGGLGEEFPFASLRGSLGSASSLSDEGFEHAPSGWWAWPAGALYEVQLDRFASASEVTCVAVDGHCGGTFAAAKGRLDYLEALGVDGVVLSPVVENMPGGYHGRWPRDLDAVSPAFGTAEELRGLVLAARRQGIKMLVDVHLDHAGAPAVAPETQIPALRPLNRSEHFIVERCHPPADDCGVLSYDHSNPDVGRSLAKWLRRHVEEFGFDGVRVAAARGLGSDFVQQLSVNGQPIPACYNLPATAPLAADLASSAASAGGLIASAGGTSREYNALYNYPLYNAIRSAFVPGPDRLSMAELARKGEDTNGGRLLLNFLDNSDSPRFSHLVDGDGALLHNALTFLLGTRGVPVILYGSEQDVRGSANAMPDVGIDVDGWRPPLWHSGYGTSGATFQLIRKLVGIRKYFNGLHRFRQRTLHSQGDLLAFSRGPLIFVTSRLGAATNDPASNARRYEVTAGRRDRVLCNLLSADPHRDCVHVSQSGRVGLDLSDGEPRLYAPLELLRSLPTELWMPLPDTAVHAVVSNNPAPASMVALPQSRWSEMPEPPEVHVRSARRIPRSPLPPGVVITDRPDWTFAPGFEMPRDLDRWAPPVGARMDYTESVRASATCHYIDVDAGLRVMLARRGSSTYALCPGGCGSLPEKMAASPEILKALPDMDARPVLHLTYGKLYVGGLYHMLVQILPGIMPVLPQLRDGSMRLFLDGPWKLVRPALTRLGVPLETIIIPPGAGEKMAFCTSQMHFGSVDDHPSPETLHSLREALSLPRNETRRSIVILSRGRDARSISNEPEMAEALHAATRRPVEIVNPGQVGLPALLETLSRAEVVVGVHGANLANMIYAPGGTKVLEIVPQVPFNPVNYHYRALAGSLNFEYRPVGQMVDNYDAALAADPMTQSIAVQTFPVDVKLAAAELQKLLEETAA